MSQAYEMVVGLEVHVQLATRTKLFCACPTDGASASPNSRICPLCTGQPGALPVLNRAAVEMAFRAALALNCRLAPASVFARKNYFYPDLPKAYQISQYEKPFSADGWLDIRLPAGGEKRIRIRRIHLEEDAGKLLHAVGSRELDHSLVDFNRSGVPLIEIVSEADIRSADEAVATLKALREIIQYLGVSRCDMEKGELRCDANVSVRPAGTAGLGTRAELKNLNSLRSVKDALEYEFRRQSELLAGGGSVTQETRLWDAKAGVSEAMRSKEEADDYRYFPDPDLNALAADAKWAAELKAGLPELPAARRDRLVAGFGVSGAEAELLTCERALADYFEAAVRGLAPGAAKTAVNLIATELLARLNAEGLGAASAKIAAEQLGALAGLVEDGTLSSKGAKAAFAAMWDGGESAACVVERLGLAQVSDEARLADWVAQALKANPKAVADLRAGNERALGAIVGAVMKLSKGKANPVMVNRLIQSQISGVRS